MPTEILITDDQFRDPLVALTGMKLADRRRKAKSLGAGKPRGYFVDTKVGELSLKLVTRLAYSDAGLPWPKGEGPQSGAVYRRFKGHFPLIHRPQARPLKGSQLSKQSDLEHEYVKRLARRGQAKFRNDLLAIDARCAITGCLTVNALEAAHIRPVKDVGESTVANGLLLRADIHRLFDLGYLAVDPASGKIWLHKVCRKDYKETIRSTMIDHDKIAKARKAFEYRWKNRTEK